MNSSDVPHPECDRMSAVQDKSFVLGEFLDWLEGRGMVLAKWKEDQLWPTYIFREELLAAFFDIDLKKVEAEKRAILEAIREVPRA